MNYREGDFLKSQDLASNYEDLQTYTHRPGRPVFTGLGGHSLPAWETGILRSA